MQDLLGQKNTVKGWRLTGIDAWEYSYIASYEEYVCVE